MRKRLFWLTFFFVPFVTFPQTILSDVNSVKTPVFYLRSDSGKPYDLSDCLRVFEDSLGTLTIREVSSPDFSTRFHENTFSRKPWEDQSYVIWGRIVIQNSSGKDQQLFLSGGFGDSIICYKQTAVQSFESRITGMRVLLHETENTMIPHTDFEYSIRAGETETFYFRLSQDDYTWLPNKAPLKLYTYSSVVQLQQQLRISWLVNGIYFGMAFLMLIYALALLLIFHEKNYLWLALFQLSNIFFFLDKTGIGFQLVYPESILLLKYGNPFFLCGLVFWHFMFITSYLEIRKMFPRTYAILLIITVIAAFSRIIFWIFGYYQLGRYIEDFAILVMILSLFTVVFYMASRLNMRRAKLMILSEIPVFITGIISGLTFTQVIHLPTHYAITAVQVGFALQMLLWTFAIVDKLILIRKEKELSQAKALEMARANRQLINDRNVILGKKVEERTRKLRETQSQLIQSGKMASLGMLTVGIAHEINNPINFINSGVISLHKDYDDLNQIIQAAEPLPTETRNLARGLNMHEILHSIPETIEEIKTGVNMTSAIVKGLLNFTRLDTSDLKETDIHGGIDSTLLLLNHQIGERTRIVKVYDERIGLVKCYPGPLNQVFMNILINAIEALDRKTEMDSSGGSIPDNPFQIEIVTNLIEEEGRSHVMIMIRDNGTGISEEIRDKLFDPFFTTKEAGKGIGLGLSVCREIMEKHGGKITFESKVNEGTVFTIALPVV